MTIEPKDAKPDQPYEVTCGGERLVAQRIAPNDGGDPWYLIPPAESSLAGRQVDLGIRDLVPLVPARNVTRADLPASLMAWKAASKSGGVIPSQHFVSEVLDAVVAHLNENGGVPAVNLGGWGQCTFGQKSGELTQRLKELGFAPGEGIFVSPNPAEPKPYQWGGDENGPTCDDYAEAIRNVAGVGEPKKYQWGGAVGGDCAGGIRSDVPVGDEVLGNPEKSEKSSCCEEAALNANEAKAKHDLWLAEFKRAEHTLSELARRNEELSEAEVEIAALTKRAEAEREERERLSKVVDGLNEALGRQNVRAAEFRHRAEKAEAERDEARAERDKARALAESKLGYLPLDLRHADLTNRAERAEAERDELQAKLDSLSEYNDKLDRERNEARDLAARNTAKWSEESAKVRELTAERDKLHRELSDVIEVSSAQYDELQAKLDAAESDWEAVEPATEVVRALVDAGWTPPESEDE